MIIAQVLNERGYAETGQLFALKGHLLSEYLLNRIIDERIKESNKYKNATYSNKLRILEKEKLLADYIIWNLRLLNSFRNKMAHELDVTINYSEMVFFKTDKTSVRVKTSRKRYPQRHYLKLLTHGVLTQLTNHMLLELKIDPAFRLSN